MRKPLRRQLTNTLLSRGLACLTNYDIFFLASGVNLRSTCLCMYASIMIVRLTRL